LNNNSDSVIVSEETGRFIDQQDNSKALDSDNDVPAACLQTCPSPPASPAHTCSPSSPAQGMHIK